MKSRISTGQCNHPVPDKQSSTLRGRKAFNRAWETLAALLLTGESEVVLAADKAGYLVFEDVEKLMRYGAEHILDDPAAVLPTWGQHVRQEAVAVVELVIDHDLLRPEVDYDVMNSSGEVVGSFELAWPERAIGIWNARGCSSPIPETMAGWHLYGLEEITEAPYLLSRQLRRSQAA